MFLLLISVSKVKRKQKSLLLMNRVAINYRVEDLEEADYPANYFDAIAFS